MTKDKAKAFLRSRYPRIAAAGDEAFFKGANLNLEDAAEEMTEFCQQETAELQAKNKRLEYQYRYLVAHYADGDAEVIAERLQKAGLE